MPGDCIFNFSINLHLGVKGLKDMDSSFRGVERERWSFVEEGFLAIGGLSTMAFSVAGLCRAVSSLPSHRSRDRSLGEVS
jgi:hypothetical protein